MYVVIRWNVKELKQNDGDSFWSRAVWLVNNNNNNDNTKAHMDVRYCTHRGKKEIAMQLICLEHVQWKVLVIHSNMRSSCTPFMTSVVWLCYHLHFVQVCLIALYKFGKNLSPSNIFDVQNTAFLSQAFGMRKESEKLSLCTCNCGSYCLRSSDRIWQVKGGNCAFSFWLRLIFHHLLAPVPALNEISCVRFRTLTDIMVIAWEALGEKRIGERFSHAVSYLGIAWFSLFLSFLRNRCLSTHKVYSSLAR